MSADVFYDRLQTETNKNKVLVDMFLTLIGKPKANIYQVIGKLTKAYGHNLAFYSILDCYDMEKLNSDNPYPILAYFAKKRLEASHNIVQSRDLSSFSKEIEKVKRAKV